MSKCPNCKENVTADVQFCTKCGQLVKSVKNIKDYVDTSSLRKKSDINQKKADKNKFKGIKDILTKIKSKVPRKVDKTKISKFFKKFWDYIKKLRHPINSSKPILGYFANHKYIFILTIFGVIFVGSCFISLLSKIEHKTTEVQFTQQPLKFPQSGIMEKYYTEPTNASIKIATQSSIRLHYLIKAIDTKNNSTIAIAFLNSGESINIGIPVGIYEVRYAVGVNWYGMKYNFGPNTYYGKTVQKIDLSTPDTYPYLIELYNQYGSNLRTDQIELEDFDIRK